MNKEMIIEKFGALKATDKTLLKVIAVNGGDLNRTKITQMMPLFGKSIEEKALTSTAKLKPVIDRLVNLRLIDNSLAMDQDVADFVVKNFVSPAEAQEIALMFITESNIEYYLDYPINSLSPQFVNKFTKHLRLCILAGVEDNFPAVKRKLLETGFFLSVVKGICLDPFSSEKMDKLPSGMASDLMEGIMARVFLDNADVPEEAVEYFVSKFINNETDETKLPRRLYLIAMSQLISKGRFDIVEIESLGLTRQNDYYGLFGLDLLLSGKTKEAADYFKELILTSRKTTRKKSWLIPGLCGQIYLIMAMSGHITEADQAMNSYFNFASKNWDLAPESRRSVEYLSKAWQVKTLKVKQKEFKNWAEFEANYGKNIQASTYLFLVMACSLVHNQPPDYIGTSCLEARKRIKRTGSPWLYSELTHTLQSLNIEGKASISATKPFVSYLLESLEKWRSDLEAIKMALSESEKKKTYSDRRMAWIIDLDQGILAPLEQKLNSKGEWSSGRKASVKRLKNEKDSFLTDQDARIIDSTEMLYDYYKGYELSLRIEKAAPFLAGHPFIFEKKKDGSLEKVDISTGKPSLSVKKQKDSIRVRITPFPDDRRISLIKEPPSKIKVVSFSEELIRISRIIGKNGLSAPMEAEEIIKEILAPASPVLEIESDIAASVEHVETVESDHCPAILLYPAGAGIRADVSVLPLGENGPSFKPGQGGEIIMTEIEGKKIQTSRNLQLEKTKAKEMISLCPSLERSSKSFNWYSEDLEDILELISELKDTAEKGLATVVWPEGKSLGIRANVDTDKMDIKISSGVDWFEVQGSICADDGTIIDIKRIIENISPDSRFVKLGESEFLALSKSLHKKLLAMESASEQTKSGLKVAKGAAVMLRDILSDMKGAKADKAWNDYQKRIDAALSLEPVIPSTLQAELRTYQAEGFTWLCRLAALGTGACLADDMGLGKTVQTLGLLLEMASKGPSLVVAPTSVCGNWVSETLKFAPTLNPIVFGGSEREQMLKKLGPMDLLIVSYGLMQQDENLFEERKWNVVVLDEAQAIKNETAKRTKTALKLKADFRLITTGTPVENSLDELYTLFSFINPGLLGSRAGFNEKFAVPIEKEKNRSAQSRLRQLIRPFILRRLRTDVLDDLPEKTEIVIKIETDEKQTAFYEALRRDIVTELEQTEGKPTGQKYLQILAGITKLRLASCHPELAVPGCGIAGAKTDSFMELVEELIENRHKALIFSQFTSFLSIVRKILDARGIKYLYLDGSTPAKERNASVAAFQAGKADLFLISLKAGGTGLNLTAANYVIHLDPWWNPAVEDQASARAHRMGQKQPVTIYRLVMAGSIEEKIMALHRHKKNLAESILEGTEAAGKMSAEELMNLIKNG